MVVCFGIVIVIGLFSVVVVVVVVVVVWWVLHITIGDCYMCAAWSEQHGGDFAEATNAVLQVANSMHAIVPHRAPIPI